LEQALKDLWEIKMTRQEILNSNLPPQEKQKRLNMLDQISASTANASLGGLLQSSMQNMGNNPLGITPRPMLPQTPTPPANVDTLSLRNLPASPNVDLRTTPRQGVQPPTIAQQIQPPRTANKGIFNRLERAYTEAAPMLAMAQEFNRMGAARPMGSNVQADPMGAYRKAKYGNEQNKKTSDMINAKAMFPNSQNPLQEYYKYKSSLEPDVFGQELMGSTYKKLAERKDTASSALFNLENIQALLDGGVQTGAWESYKLDDKRIAQALGFRVDDDDIASQEAFVSFSTKTILPLVKDLGVNPTDKDLEFVKEGTPTLEKTETGNRIMLEALLVSQKRIVEEHKIKTQILAEFGTNIGLARLEQEFQRRTSLDIEQNPDTSIWNAGARLQEKYRNFKKTKANRFAADD
jgi:hypothetical protein